MVFTLIHILMTNISTRKQSRKGKGINVVIEHYHNDITFSIVYEELLELGYSTMRKTASPNKHCEKKAPIQC